MVSSVAWLLLFLSVNRIVASNKMHYSSMRMKAANKTVQGFTGSSSSIGHKDLGNGSKDGHVTVSQHCAAWREVCYRCFIVSMASHPSLVRHRVPFNV